MLALGGAGLMNAVGNVAPGDVAALCTAVAGGDHVTALSLHRRLFELNQAVFFDTNPVPIKWMLARLGLCEADVRPPLAPLHDGVAARVDAVLERYSEVSEHTGSAGSAPAHSIVER
jgi:4-hydroxy-tetrahydrodipicolinate synthase